MLYEVITLADERAGQVRYLESTLDTVMIGQRDKLHPAASREILKHVTSRWGVLLLVALLGGTHRFSDLRRKIGGVSERNNFV